MNSSKKIAILGIVGVPGRYGGFETLAENLVDFHLRQNLPEQIIVYCSIKAYDKERSSKFKHADLLYLPLSANGVSSIAYDIISLFHAAFCRVDRILLLGVSGAIAIPIIRVFSRSEITVNIDGLEWKRAKWRSFAKKFLKFSERIAVRYSHKVIADNQAIAEYVADEYGQECKVIAYGGDHANLAATDVSLAAKLPDEFALSLCRIEPENNVELILDAWQNDGLPLVFVGNWDHSEFGSTLKSKYQDHSNIHLIDPVYDPRLLKGIREKATVYVHGHSAGGTNPSLVEMMHFGIPVVAFDCTYNRHTTKNKAMYFSTLPNLRATLEALARAENSQIGTEMKSIAQEFYVWDKIGQQYFDFLLK